jgi:glutathione S-transferase
VEAKLYVILGSHACRAAILMLDYKGIRYEPVELPTGLHPFALRLRGFKGNPEPFRELDGKSSPMLGMADRAGTVPALVMDGRHVKTNREIARFLDRVRPEPPLFPADPARRAEVEEAERWGDEVFQMTARRIALAGVRHGPDAMLNRGDDGRLGPLLFRSQRMRLLGTRMLALFIFRVDADAEAKLQAELPGMLDRIDGWIEAGVLNGEELNAADFMIAPSLALISYRRDLRPELERRPLIGLIDRVLPEPPGVAASTVAA